MLRIAVVFPEPYDPSELSLDLGLLVDGFTRCGVAAQVVAVRGSTRSFDHPTVLAPDVRALESIAFWRGLACHLAVVVTWGTRGRILRAARLAGAVVVSKLDTDGLIGVRSFPLLTLRRMLAGQQSALGRLGATWFWLKKLAYWHRREVAEVLHSLAQADLVWLESPAAERGVAAFLSRHRRGEPTRRLLSLPNPVADCFRHQEGRPATGSHIVAVGRWNHAQKNAPLLAAAFERLSRRRPDCRFSVVGHSARTAFRRLLARPLTQVHDRLPRSEIARLFADAQIVAFSSRWEGGRSNVANEALAMGCTIVAPALPSFADLGFENRFGRVVAAPSAAALAAALDDELTDWDSGKRDRAAISAHWRPQLDPQRVCRELLEAAALGDTSARRAAAR